jgi:hypothetical protein
VGPRPANLIARYDKPDQVYVTCNNNRGFWMCIDGDTCTAHGVVHGCRRNGTALFIVQKHASGFIVLHPLAPWFRLELTAPSATAPLRNNNN